MNAYMYRAAMLCGECGLERIRQCNAMGVGDNGDSDTFPQGPYPQGGGESDYPQHCDDCGLFLENPLTDEGRHYVRATVGKGRGDADALAEWERE